ncbi:beta-N-acetylglucosaminidase [Corynebacterium sp. HMSC08C04]|uniref:beta-N-acetylglucosaminidase n=1 Tax=Corynebacterium sp. HMSC08C04 TaxID=1581137 RepID=UPI000B09C6D0|nr:beta-N-acetylglucosaminidase [Corynebacterium sp. HMSC08C04]
MRNSLSARTACVAAGLFAASCSLAACGDGQEASQPAPAAPVATSQEAETPTPKTSESTATTTSSEQSSAESTTSEETESGASESASASATAAKGEKKGNGKLSKQVEEAYETFETLVPVEIFQQFDRCDPNGVADSYNCSGSEIGQFQFFKNKSKAAQTTQVLTELRSSRVVKDEGDRVVGWSMLGNTAILTVVDNKDGLVMQQMISTDQDDPEERLKELGLI